MILTKDANKITGIMGLIIMLVSKNFKSIRMSRIFKRTNGISKTFVKYMNQLGMSRYSVGASNYPYGYFCGKELQGSGTRDS